eukprot:371912-Prorocentrum_minimum.AAC.2
MDLTSIFHLIPAVTGWEKAEELVEELQEELVTARLRIERVEAVEVDMREELDRSFCALAEAEAALKAEVDERRLSPMVISVTVTI